MAMNHRAGDSAYTPMLQIGPDEQREDHGVFQSKSIREEELLNNKNRATMLAQPSPRARHGNHAQSLGSTYQPALFGPPSKHTTWTATTFAMAKCDCCEKQRRPMIQSCNKCSFSICRECYDAGKLDENTLHEINEESVRWSVVGSKRARAYTTTTDQTSGRASSSRIKAGRSTSTRARENAQPRPSSPSEESSPETIVGSPFTDAASASETPGHHEITTSAQKEECSDYDLGIVDTMRDSTDDEASNKEIGTAAGILAGLTYSPPTTARSTRRQSVVLRYNGVEMKLGNRFSPVTRAAVLPSFEHTTGRSQAYRNPRRALNHEVSVSGIEQLASVASPYQRRPEAHPEASTVLDTAPRVFEPDVRMTDTEEARHSQSPPDSSIRPPTNKHSRHSFFPYQPGRYRGGPYSGARLSAHSSRTRRRAIDAHSPRTHSSLGEQNDLAVGSKNSALHRGCKDEGKRHNPATFPPLPSYTEAQRPVPGHEPPLHDQDGAASEYNQPPAQGILPQKVDVGLLSQHLQTNTEAMNLAHPGQPLDHCLRDQVAIAWTGGAVHRFIAGVDDSGNDDRNETAVFRVLLSATYHACLCLGLEESIAAREWLCELEQYMEEHGGGSVASTVL